MNNVNNHQHNKNNNLQDKITKLILFGVVYTFFFVLFISTIKYTLPFILASIFAFILRKPTKLIIKTLNCKSWLASMVSTIIFFSFIILTLIISISCLTSELSDLAKKLQLIITNNSYYYFNNIQILLQKSLANFFVLDNSITNNIISTLTALLNNILQFGISNISSLISSLFSIFSYIPYVVTVIAFTLLSTYFFTQKLVNSTSANLKVLAPINRNKILIAFHHSKKMLINYFLSYFLLIFLSTSISFAGFLIFKIDYALLLSILAGFLDILPVVGIACVYIPLILYFFINGDLLISLGLIILYILIFLSRQFLEPKIMSTSLGISPISTLISTFIGIQLGGFIGVIFLMFFLVFYKILKCVELL